MEGIRMGLLDEWYAFENSRHEQAIRDWCRENDLQLTDDSGGDEDSDEDR